MKFTRLLATIVVLELLISGPASADFMAAVENAGEGMLPEAVEHSAENEETLLYIEDVVATVEPVEVYDETSREGTTVGYVMYNGVKLFEENSNQSKVLVTLGTHDRVLIVSEINDWCKVVYDSRIGYILKAELSTKPISEDEEEDSTEAENSQAEPEITQETEAALEIQEPSEGASAIDSEENPVLEDESEPQDEDESKAEAEPEQGDELKDEDEPEAEAEPDEPEQIVFGLEALYSELYEEGVEYSAAKPARGTAVAVDWWTSDIQEIFPRGATAVVTDVETGISWNVMRKGGTSHADVQPLTAADTNSMKAVCENWSWDRRAIFVTINGVNYAASMNCMPHGDGSIADNNFNGHHCIHFVNSRTHGGNNVCPLHQGAIETALNASM